jgi:ABC-2 type transport system ATP-binding protein
MTQECLIEIKNLSKTFKGSSSPAIDNLNLNLKSGGIVGLVGPDGAGKTTLMRLALGLLKSTSVQFPFAVLIPLFKSKKNRLTA